jgi:cyclic beta-1,2-glucan synthetase
VLAADVAGVAPHLGRGGWTWYTGSAAWMWRLAIEENLGLRLKNGQFLVDPRLPASWGWFEATIRGPAGTLQIRVEHPDHVGNGVIEADLDGIACADLIVPFPTDGSVRHMRLRLSQGSSTEAIASDRKTTRRSRVEKARAGRSGRGR